MILSRVRLDTQNRKTMEALSAPSMFHGAIESSFSGERPHCLWRIDEFAGRTWLLILSGQEPNLSALQRQFGVEEEGWESRQYDALLGRIAEGQSWHFRLKANPVRSVPAAGEARGKVMAHVTVQQQKQWLLDRCGKHGFALDPDGFDVVQSTWYHFSKGADRRHKVSLSAVTFEGILSVTDAEMFCKALREGIGRGKAYGLGLLTVTGR